MRKWFLSQLKAAYPNRDDIQKLDVEKNDDSLYNINEKRLDDKENEQDS